MKHIITITGNSGVGKDTVAEWLADHHGWKQIVSNTTRPMRDGETNGKEHHFHPTPSEPIGRDNIKDVLAYTQYGGYEYWTTWTQLGDSLPNIYVIDEKGLLELLEARAMRTDIRLVTIKVVANDETIRARGVSEERIARDKEREDCLKFFKYDYVVKNNKSLKALDKTLRGLDIQASVR